MPHLEKHAEAEGIGERGDNGKLAFGALAEVSNTLADLSNETCAVAEAVRIGAPLGLEGRKVSVRLKGVMRAKLKSIQESIMELMAWAENVENQTVNEDEGTKRQKDRRALVAARHALNAAEAAVAIDWSMKAVDNKALSDLHEGLDHLDTLHGRIIHDKTTCPLGVGGGPAGKTQRKVSSGSDDDDQDMEAQLPHMHGAIKTLLAHHDAVHPDHDVAASYGYTTKPNDGVSDNDGDEKQKDDENNRKGGTSRNGAGDGWKHRNGKDEKKTVEPPKPPDYESEFAELGEVLVRFAPPSELVSQ